MIHIETTNDGREYIYHWRNVVPNEASFVPWLAVSVFLALLKKKCIDNDTL